MKIPTPPNPLTAKVKRPKVDKTGRVTVIGGDQEAAANAALKKLQNTGRINLVTGTVSKKGKP